MKNEILDSYRKVQSLVNEEAYDVTCNILKITDDIPEAFGTGVFIKADGLHFLITAAHVAEKIDYELCVGTKSDTAFKLGGNLLTNNIDIPRDWDKFDLCVFKLCDETTSTIAESYKFLDISEIEVSHDFRPYLMYQFVGFPATKSKYSKFHNRLKSVPFIYTTMPSNEEAIFKTLKCNSSFNVIVNYDKKKVYKYKTGASKIGPDLYGISGCGLWYTPPQIDTNQKVVKKLVAILTEWPINNRKYLIATRIDLFTEILRQQFNCRLPKTKFFNYTFKK